MGRAKETIEEKKLSSWKLLDDDYFNLMLFGLFNPVLDSMRGLCAASHLKRVQEDVCGRQVSLGTSVLRQAPCDAIVTAGNSCERKALREFAKKGEIIVGDRYYGLEASLDEVTALLWRWKNGELKTRRRARFMRPPWRSVH